MNNKLTQEDVIKLLKRAKKGDEESQDTLIDNYKKMVKSIVRGFFLIGGDAEDLMQEGMIGLYKAMQSYNASNKATFTTFAYLCVLRQIQSAIRSSFRKGRFILGDFLPISNQGMIVLDDTNNKGIYLISSELSPEENVIQREHQQELSDIIKKQISNFEFKVLGLYLKGYSHFEIAQKLGKDIKSVSNAIFRIRTKLQNFFGGENVSSAIS